MKTLAALLALAGIISVLLQQMSVPKDMSFEEFKSTYGLKFDSKFEEKYRERIFKQNVAKINTHNSRNDQTYEMGINQFTHLTQEEFSSTYLTANIYMPIGPVDESFISVGDVDWVAAGAVTPVKNQGSCASQWAFSATGALEGLSKIVYGTLQSFSEQQLVDCSGSYGNSGCNGGSAAGAFKFVIANGITTESAYPYKAVAGSCLKKTGDFKVSGYSHDPGCNALAQGIIGQPVSVSVDASNWSPYRSGIFSDCQNRINHGVLTVGVTDTYWVVKNCWGTSWGENGYIRLLRGTDSTNTCGICTNPSFPNK